LSICVGAPRGQARPRETRCRQGPRRQLEARREQLRTSLPIGRVVGPADIAALAVHLMTNAALTGATYDIDGGEQLVEG
jgi:NAD(P)-dependent dehydrogenase (short-subunit alcohol dehydrogenase family)